MFTIHTCRCSLHPPSMLQHTWYISKAHIFFTGSVSNILLTDACGKIVCLFGLCIPQASLAKTWKSKLQNSISNYLIRLKLNILFSTLTAIHHKRRERYDDTDGPYSKGISKWQRAKYPLLWTRWKNIKKSVVSMERKKISQTYAINLKSKTVDLIILLRNLI